MAIKEISIVMFHFNALYMDENDLEIPQKQASFFNDQEIDTPLSKHDRNQRQTPEKGAFSFRIHQRIDMLTFCAPQLRK